MSLRQKIDTLINTISEIPEVLSIGISGGDKPFPNPGEGDIDVFIYCDTIPSENTRQCILAANIEETKINEFEGGHWGTGDFALVEGVETWFMYFTKKETYSELSSTLAGQLPDKLDNYYYPTGRCEMLRNIWIRYDSDGFLGGLQKQLSVYPEGLTTKLNEYHLLELDDIEDLERAVKRRDVLFYHFALDISIDYFLQALFSLNKTFFPSRKRSIKYIKEFTIKPQKCEELLLKTVQLGSCADTLEESYMLWRSLTEELKSLV